MIIIDPEPQGKRITGTDYAEFPGGNLGTKVVFIAVSLGVGRQGIFTTVHVFNKDIRQIYPAQFLVVLRVLPFSNLLVKERITYGEITDHALNEKQQSEYDHHVD